jgi:DNA-binding transcriptional ArsR family regulator
VDTTDPGLVDGGTSRDLIGFVERLGSTFTDAGFPRLPARVFAALLVDDDGRMTAAELADLLRVSPGAVSGAVKYLAGMHMLHREREPGSRRDIYVIREDAWHDTLINAASVYDPFVRVLGSGVDVVGRQTRAGTRLAESVEFLEFLAGEMKGIAERWEERRSRERSAGSTT